MFARAARGRAPRRRSACRLRASQASRSIAARTGAARSDLEAGGGEELPPLGLGVVADVRRVAQPLRLLDPLVDEHVVLDDDEPAVDAGHLRHRLANVGEVMRGDPAGDDVEARVGERKVLGEADDVRLHPGRRIEGDDLAARPRAAGARRGRRRWRRRAPSAGPRLAHSTIRSRSGPSRCAGLSRYAAARSVQASVTRPPAPRPGGRRRASSARRGGWPGPASASIRRPSSAFVPSRRTTIGSVDPHLVERREDAAGDLVAARDPAEDVEEDRAHLRVARDHLERVDDALRVSPAAEVAEVRRACPPATTTTSTVDIESPAPLPRIPTSPSSFT